MDKENPGFQLEGLGWFPSPLPYQFYNNKMQTAEELQGKIKRSKVLACGLTYSFSRKTRCGIHRPSACVGRFCPSSAVQLHRG